MKPLCIKEVALLLISDALNIKVGFDQIAIFLW